MSSNFCEWDQIIALNTLPLIILDYLDVITNYLWLMWIYLRVTEYFVLHFNNFLGTENSSRLGIQHLEQGMIGQLSKVFDGFCDKWIIFALFMC